MDRDGIGRPIIHVPVTCPRCKTDSQITVVFEQWNVWKSGAFIQDAFPEMDADTREQLISGMCGKCWVEVFSSEEDEE